jgi:hypothetical protein
VFSGRLNSDQNKVICMLKKISSGSTIASVWPYLTDQRDYVAGTLHKAKLCRDKHGNSFVKIGVTGTGQKPCYRVFFKTEEGVEEIFGSYWDTHQPLDNEHAVSENWSTAAMTYEEVYALMIEKHPPRSMPLN